jgi:NTP pyrophosphatase (non-canonical NTP hydrolase)
MTEEKQLNLYNRALKRYGIDAQKLMVVEECGELLNALAKTYRGRASIEELITELADVHIMVEQMALYYGWAEFQEEKERKLERLQQRLYDTAKAPSVKQKTTKDLTQEFEPLQKLASDRWDNYMDATNRLADLYDENEQLKEELAAQKKGE